MEHGQHDFEGAFMLLLVHIHRDTATVVDHGDGVILIYCYFYMSGIAGKSLVNRVVDNFIDKMMQTFETYVANIHGGAFSHRLQAFKHLDITGAIDFFAFFVFRHNLYYNISLKFVYKITNISAHRQAHRAINSP